MPTKMSQEITEDQYRKMFFPLFGWLFVEKDMMQKETAGGIILPDKPRKDSVKWGMTGEVIEKSPFPPTESDWHGDLWQVIKKGDHVGFSATTPILSPCPPYYYFESGTEKEESKFICFHIADVLGMILETEEEIKDFFSRFKETK